MKKLNFILVLLFCSFISPNGFSQCNIAMPDNVVNVVGTIISGGGSGRWHIEIGDTFKNSGSGSGIYYIDNGGYAECCGGGGSNTMYVKNNGTLKVTSGGGSNTIYYDSFATIIGSGYARILCSPMTFSYTPPTAGAISANATSACPTTTVTLTNSGATSGATRQWQSSTDSITWNNITGATASTYKFSGLSSTQYYRFKATMLSSGLSSVTPGIKITFTSTSCPCTANPGSVISNLSAACATNTVTLNNTTYTTSGTTKKWQSSPDSLSWTDMPGAISVPYTLVGFSANTYYRLVVTCTSTGTSVVSAGKKISYLATCPCTANPGTVLTNLTSACATSTVTISNSTYTTSGTNVQWQSSPDSVAWNDIAGATAASYTTIGFSATTYYRLAVTCTSSATTVYSAGKKVTYSPVCMCSGAPSGGTATASTTYCSSCTLTLGLTGHSTGTGISYQWQSSANNVTWTNITGGTVVPYTYVPSNANYYRCKVSCSAGGNAYSSSIFVDYAYQIVADSIGSPDSLCNMPKFFVKVNGNSSLLRLKTFYGDGAKDSIPFTGTGTAAYANAQHIYSLPGCYSVKQIVYYNNVAKDSLQFSYHHNFCQNLNLKFFADINGDCLKNTTESFNTMPIYIKIDSAGIPVDTLSATGGLNYKAYGAPGTVYAFSLLPGTMFVTCPSSGVIYDTVLPLGGSVATKYFALSCSPGSTFDLSVSAVVPVTGRHDQWGNIYVTNNSCMPVNATVTLHYSSRYSATPTFHAAGSILPTSYSVGTVTWDLPGLAANTTSPRLYYSAWSSPTAYLTAGDTVHEYVTVTPTTGDVNTSNNFLIKVDTVRASCDPNFVEVIPSGCFDVDTEFQYTIHFENTGTDTAHNIYVLDTLSPNLDVNSLKIIMATADMDIAILHDGPYTIAKFDFPNIMLPDSSHHGLADGAVIFNMKNRPGMANGDVVAKRAGIYFDINEVVLTNTVENTKGCPHPASVTQVSAEGISLYPNPTTHELTIETQQNTYATYTITSSIGQVLMEQPLTGQQTRTNVATLSPGLYYLTVKGEGGSKTMKFVKM